MIECDMVGYALIIVLLLDISQNLIQVSNFKQGFHLAFELHLSFQNLRGDQLFSSCVLIGQKYSKFSCSFLIPFSYWLILILEFPCSFSKMGWTLKMLKKLRG